MSDLFYCLYGYAQEHLFQRYIVREQKEYDTCVEMSERAMKKLKAMLDQEEWEQLERYVDHESGRSSIEEEALFFSGLLIGLELSRPA